MRAVHVLVVVAVMVGTSPGALGQQPKANQSDRFETAVKEGMTAYQAKDFDAAIRAFERAYAIRPEPEMVFNVAKSHEKALHLESAIAAYERFLLLEGTTSDLRARALKSLNSLKAEKKALEEAKAAPPAPPPAAQAGGPPPSGPRVALTQREPVPREKNRALEWTLFGGGMAVAVAGAVFAGLAVSNRSAFDDEAAEGEAADAERLRDLRDELDRNALIADVLVPVGLVTAAVGLSLLIVGGDDDDDFAMEVSPSFGGQQAGLNLSGEF